MRTCGGDTVELHTQSTTVGVGHGLSFCAEMVKTAALMEGYVTTAGTVENFEVIMTSSWKYEISGGA